MQNPIKKSFVERIPFDKNRISIEESKQFIEKNILREESGQWIFLCAGFLYLNETLYIIYPKGYSLTSKQDSNLYSSLLIRSLIKYRRENKLEEQEVELLDSGKPTTLSLFTIINLVEDYIQYGLFIDTMIEEKQSSSGKIHWGKTIQKVDPLHSNGFPIYDNVIVVRPKMNNDSLVRIVQIHALKEIFEKHHWLLEIIFGRKITFNQKNIPRKLNKENTLHLLKKELNSRFIHREIKLIKLLINYLEGSNENKGKSNILTLATLHFYNIWEVMCKYICNDQFKTVYPLFPQPKWYLNNKTERKINISQIPDILRYENGAYYILDAKYYSTGTLPGWGDAGKQFLYAYTLKEKLLKDPYYHKNELTIFNSFLIPHSQKDIEIIYIGKINIPEVSSLSEIHTFSLNIATVMNYYLTGQTISMNDLYQTVTKA